jgi:hypothetical protein
VGINQNRKHASSFIFFNKPHSTHICCKIVDNIYIAHNQFTIIQKAKIKDSIVRTFIQLMPLVFWLYIDRQNLKALRNESFGKVTAYESARTSH